MTNEGKTSLRPSSIKLPSPSDKLSLYHTKRERTTPEPKSGQPAELYGTYCIQEHRALKAGLHHDLRFEMDGTAVSFAIPKGVPMKGEKARLAIHTEDHPLAYMAWEGIIPPTSYGGGEVRLIDKGKREIIEASEDKFKIRLSGGDQRYAGVYSIFRQQKPSSIRVNVGEPSKKGSTRSEFLIVHKVHED